MYALTLTFSLLGASILAVWSRPIKLGPSINLPPWPLLYLLAIVAGLTFGYLTVAAMPGLAALAGSAYMAARAENGLRTRTVFRWGTALLALALALHLFPGFRNPLLIENMKFSADATPYTQHANFDKASVGLILLALLVNRARTIAEWREILVRTLPIMALTAAAVIAAALAAGYVTPKFKWSWYTPIFLATNLLFVCVAEETFFRGLLQDRISRALAHRRSGEPIAVMSSALLFGAAHLAGGPVYAGIAALAGLGYGYSYAVVKRIEAPILAHFALNAVHFIGFTYPRIQ